MTLRKASKIIALFCCILGHVTLMRFEDLSLDPFHESDRLLKFLDLAPNNLIEKFLEKHTGASREVSIGSSLGATTDNPTTTNNEKVMEEQQNWEYSTSKNSKATVFKWKETMMNEDILKVQNVCKKSMMILGYNPMTDVSENKRDVNFPLIGKLPEEFWSTKGDDNVVFLFWFI